MAEYNEQRQKLADSRRKAQAETQKLLLARESQRKQEEALAAFDRSATERDRQEREALRRKVDEAREKTAGLSESLSDLRDRALEDLKGFEEFTDPRRQIVNLRDDHPILLFPLRLETRFKTGDNSQPQLWVRVYPDNCLIDSFEPSLSDQEVANARAFWSAVWRAGGDETLEREAWRQMVASHGSGRSGWIIRHYLPINPGDKPARVAETDVLLIITAPSALPSAALTYWEAAWKATGSAADSQAAFAALEAAVGAAQARDLVENFRPFNFTDTPTPPRTRAEVTVKAVVLQLEDPEALETRRTSWSSPARIDLLPERFVVVGYSGGQATLTALGGLIQAPLVASPDPNAPPEQQLRRRPPPDDDELQIPDEIAWMFDFDKAVEMGMALRIDLTPAQRAAGFDRLVVLGVRLGDSPEEGRKHLARLLEHHLHSRAGFQILTQGTPTNNTEKGGAGYTFREDPDATFPVFMRGTPQYTRESDPLLRRDGQWLADLLGLPDDLVQLFPNAAGVDQSEARAMQIALWSGTLGYMMETLLSPVFRDGDISFTRNFFTRNVSGRGPLPALRIGKQPYGILLATDFDRINWFGDGRDPTQGSRLYNVLKRAEADWRALLGRVSFVGKPGDPHQTLLDVLGLHAASAEYYPLQAESVDHKFYELSFLSFPIAMNFLGLFPVATPLALLRSYGYTGAQVPDLLNKVYKAHQTPLTGPLIDDVPLSETTPIRKYAGAQNYIEWLIAAARVGIEALQKEQGFDGGKKPAALLYLLLRNALQQSYHETSVRLGVAAGVINDAIAARREPAFVHVTDSDASESRYNRLFKPDARITGSPKMHLGEYIARNVMTADPDLAEQLLALERLQGTPTARLERLFAEHIDCCSYRLDAWRTGLCAEELVRMRSRTGKERDREPPGLYLGAFGWLEPLRPQDRQLEAAKLPPDVAGPINQRDPSPLMTDSANLGLVHAPSLNHAMTASVLRNGYEHNGGQLAVDLSSRRVRLALGILEGMRNGQSMGALLGYQFERYIHDNGPLTVRALIYPLRRAFPLAANQIEKTNTETGTAQESIAAMNVVDGRKLVEHAEKVSRVVYPFDVATLPRPNPDNGQEQTITDALAYIRDINDAVADLILAESVHQAVSGNHERSAGVLDAFAKGSYPPEPDVIRTPRTGITLTLRTAIHLPIVPAPTLADPLPPNPPPATSALTPLSIAEPALNIWLAGRLPAPANVGCNVSFTDRASGTVVTELVTQTQLGLQPIDMLFRTGNGGDQSGDLDDRILQFIQANRQPRHDREIRIRHTERVAGKHTWFEQQALLRSLRTLVIGARPLRPADLMRANDATSDQQAMVFLPIERIEGPRDDLNDTRIPVLDAAATALGNAAVTIDAALEQYVAAVARFSEFRLPQTGTGFAYDWRVATYAAIAKKVKDRADIWNRRLKKLDLALTAYDGAAAGMTEPERVSTLQAAELLIATDLTTGFVDAADYRGKIDDRRDSFISLRDDMEELVSEPRATVAELLADAKGIGPLAPFDHKEFDLADDDAEVARFRKQLTDSLARLKTDTLERIARVDDLLAKHGTTAGSEAQARLLQEAGKILFGDDFQLVPQIGLPQDAVDELANAWQHSTSGKLTEFLTADKGRDFPVDDWLHGVARVRDKLKQWENVVLLSDAAGASAAADFVPLQLPFVVDEPWLALEFPDDHAITSDRLLYTAHFAEAFDPTKPVCGLLMDEWTEVIPGTEETTGIAFHYDRPNSEPPQCWLLALPAIRNGAWSWDELLNAVNHSLDSAKTRAVEPTHLDTTAYSTFLPATMSAYTFPEISISNNLLQNVRIYTDAAAAINVASLGGGQG